MKCQHNLIPSHSPIGLSADQFSVAVPAKVSRPARSASQSETRPGLFAGLGTAAAVEQVEAELVWAEAGWASSVAMDKTARTVATRVGSLVKLRRGGVIGLLPFAALKSWSRS